MYAHMNNAVFYEYIDTAVNAWIIESGTLPVPHGPVVGLVVASSCTFHASLGFPTPVTCGLRVDRLGRTSVTYGAGLFSGDALEAAAEASFTHVYVTAEDHIPTPLPERFRAALALLLVAP